MEIYVIGPVILMNPEFDRNFYRGVYQTKELTYQTASSMEFQNTENLAIKYGGTLRERPHFMVRGTKIIAGEKRLEETLQEVNKIGVIRPQTREEVLERVRESIPEAIIYDNHDVDIALGWARLEKELKALLKK